MIPPKVPPQLTLFYSTIDFDGRIDGRIRNVVRSATLFTCHQVHRTNVQRVGAGVPAGLTASEAPAATPTCDALWSDARQTALGIKVADCLPLSLIDPSHGVIANIHSGWRGAVQGITAATLEAAPLDPASSLAFFGPSIRVCCFEVGEEVAAQFDPRFVDRTRGAKPHVDIAAFTIDVLRRRGFQDENIIDTGLCTRCDGSIFHSYRRDKRSGRNLAIVAQ